jgi:hypothetical protein
MSSSARVYAKSTEELHKALDAAPRAEIATSKSARSERLTAWALYGYHQWLAEQDHLARLEAYKLLGADEERAAHVRASAKRSLAAGRL